MDLAALELVEYSPRLDPSGRTARVAVDIACALLAGAREQAQVVP
jgi:arginase family enzyme